MDALRVFPSSKVKRAPHGAPWGGMPVSVSRENPRYQSLVRDSNLRWVGNPRFVQVVGDAEQVRETVQSAVSDAYHASRRLQEFMRQMQPHSADSDERHLP